MTLAVANRDKVLWPDAGFTKGDMADYYVRVAPALLPHLRDRPITLRRFPDGVGAAGWYQTNCRARPEWLRVALVEGRGDAVFELCLLDDVASLVWAADMAAIELHPFLHRVPGERPDVVVYDLDPGPGVDVVECCDVALRIRERVGDAYVKTSGSVGLHVYVPAGGAGYEQTRARARELARELEAELPDLVVARQRRELRLGRVLVDWLQNDRMRSTVAPYSLRAVPWPTVSTPLAWDEVERCARERRPERLTFLAADALDRLDRHGDLFAELAPET